MYTKLRNTNFAQKITLNESKTYWEVGQHIEKDFVEKTAEFTL